MSYAAIDIHKHAFQAAVLDPDSGEVVEERFSADRESLARWAQQWQGRVEALAIEATTGWRWVWRELVAVGFEVRLAEPVQARGLLGRRRSAKTDRLDARWLARLLAKEMQRAAPAEQTRAWRRRYRYRNGIEGRISQLKRKGLARTRLRATSGIEETRRTVEQVTEAVEQVSSVVGQVSKAVQETRQEATGRRPPLRRLVPRRATAGND